MTEEVKDKVYSVSEFIDYLNVDFHKNLYTIKGEICDVGIRERVVYFSLMDKKDNSILKCLVWKNVLRGLGIEALEEGKEAKITGYLNIHKQYGSYKLIADYITLTGEGELKKALERLKLQLQKNGYFDLERKRQIPPFIENIGLITSDGSDAQKDFLTHLGSYGFKIYFYDVRVEGLQAVDHIVNAIKWFNENTTNMEALVITRGGGSLESLQAFNSEMIAKTIYSSKIPIITAIGHENDETIADLVADLHASTPTDAGKTLSQSWRELPEMLDSYEINIKAFFRRKYEELRDKINDYESSFIGNFKRMIRDIKQVEENFFYNYERFNYNFRFLNQKIEQLEGSLTASNPELKLKQGYSITRNVYGKIIRQSDDVEIGDELKIKLYKGSIHSIANKKDND